VAIAARDAATTAAGAERKDIGCLSLSGPGNGRLPMAHVDDVQTPTLQTSTDEEPLTHVQAFRLPDSGYGCGTVPDFDRLPLHASNVDL
jgi:hypothetical protein